MSFWQKQIENAKQRKIRQEKRKALTNPDFRLNHNDEWKDAQRKIYTKLEARVAAEHEREVAKNLERRQEVGKGKR